MKYYIVNAITKANVLNKVNNDVYDMLKIFLNTNLYILAFNISLVVTDKLQKLKTFHTSHIWVYLTPQKYPHGTLIGFEVYYYRLSHK
jgi:hypothetical protein